MLHQLHALLRLFEPVARTVLARRDTRLLAAQARSPAGNVFENRSLERLSGARIDLSAQLCAIRALERQIRGAA